MTELFKRKHHFAFHIYSIRQRLLQVLTFDC